MGLSFFKRSIELVNQYRKPGQQVTYTLQTNGTKLDDEWCAFFKQHNFLIGLSIDGPQEIHNTYRIDKGGKGSFEKVKRGWDLLQKHNVDTNVLCAVHAANAPHPLEVYRFFRDELQAEFIQFIPVVDRLNIGNHALVDDSQQKLTGKRRLRKGKDGELVSQYSVKPNQFGTFLIDIFEEWVHHDVGNVFIQTFEAALAGWCHLPASVCIFQEVCGSSLVLEHNGDLYSCDHFVDQDYRLGNILESQMTQLVNAPQQRQFGLDKRDRLSAICQSCDVLFACHGECPRNRFPKASGRIGDGPNYLCSGYRQFFHHIDRPMRIMSALIRSGRSPAEILGILN